MENTESGDTVASSAIHTEGNEETAGETTPEVSLINQELCCTV